MRILRDFECVMCGIVTEKLCSETTYQIMCPDCGCDATALLSTPSVKLEGITGSFPGAHDKWAKIREDNARIKAARS